MNLRAGIQSVKMLRVPCKYLPFELRNFGIAHLLIPVIKITECCPNYVVWFWLSQVHFEASAGIEIQQNSGFDCKKYPHYVWTGLNLRIFVLILCSTYEQSVRFICRLALRLCFVRYYDFSTSNYFFQRAQKNTAICFIEILIFMTKDTQHSDDKHCDKEITYHKNFKFSDK